MAVVPVAITDSLVFPTGWELPPSPVAIRSPIPRGLITFTDTTPIALLAAGDETAFSLALTMPDGYAYLPRNLMIQYGSDDLENNFNLNGNARYDLTVKGVTKAGATRPRFNMICPAETIEGATQARKVWTPGPGSMKLLMRGGDVMIFFLADMDAGGSPAGNIGWFCEFYVFDPDQVDKWEINTPIPTIAHTSF